MPSLPNLNLSGSNHPDSWPIRKRLLVLALLLILITIPLTVTGALTVRDQRSQAATYSIAYLSPNDTSLRTISPLSYRWSCYCVPNNFQVILYNEALVINGSIQAYYTINVRGNEQFVWNNDSRWRRVAWGVTSLGKPTNLPVGAYHWAVIAWNGTVVGKSATATFILSRIF